MRKIEIARQLAEKLDISYADGMRMVQGTIDAIVDTVLRDGRIELRGFGVFRLVKRKSKKARNPKKNIEVIIPERHTIIFKPGRQLKKKLAEYDALNLRRKQ